MGIRSRLSVGGRIYSGFTTSIGITARRIRQIRLPNLKERMPLEMFVSGYIPYKAEETYKTMMTEFECTRARNQVEIQRQLVRGL